MGLFHLIIMKSILVAIVVLFSCNCYSAERIVKIKHSVGVEEPSYSIHKIGKKDRVTYDFWLSESGIKCTIVGVGNYVENFEVKCLSKTGYRIETYIDCKIFNSEEKSFNLSVGMLGNKEKKFNFWCE